MTANCQRPVKDSRVRGRASVQVQRATFIRRTSKLPKGPLSREQDDSDIAHLAAGDEDVMDYLIRRYGKKLRQYLKRIVKDQTDAADLTEEAFIRVFQHRTDFDRRARFSTWLYTIAKHLGVDLLRQRARRPNHVALSDVPIAQLLDGAASPSEQLEADERTGILDEAVASLADDVSVSLKLFAFEGWSQAEVAAYLGCSTKCVEMRLYHARQKLRAFRDRDGQPVFRCEPHRSK